MLLQDGQSESFHWIVGNQGLVHEEHSTQLVENLHQVLR